MEVKEFIRKFADLQIAEKTKVITQRVCNEGDFKGAVDIIMGDKSICAFSVHPIGMRLNIEKFITTDDEGFNKEAREILLTHFIGV